MANDMALTCGSRAEVEGHMARHMEFKPSFRGKNFYVAATI